MKKQYTLIILSPFDDVPDLKYITMEEIQEIIKNHNLMKWDYAIINGTVLKTFDNGSFDIKGLK